MKRQKTILFTLILILTFSIGAQNKRSVAVADKKFEDFEYIDALEIYEEVAADYADADLYNRIADGYYFVANYPEAAKWYKKLKDLEGFLSPKNGFKYGQCLKSMGQYEDSDFYLTSFYNSQGIEFMGSGKYLKVIYSSSNQYKIVDELNQLNTENSDYPTFMSKDTLYYISAGDQMVKNPWNNEPTSDIYLFNGKTHSKTRGDINSKFNEGSLVITKDGKTMYFTRNNLKGKRRGKDEFKVSRLKIYRAQKVKNKWTNIYELPFNDDSFSIGHPTLSVDEKKLYFVSDMTAYGNKGGTDLFEVDILENGNFSEPKNLEKLNTPMNEMFPYMANDGTLYFSSNGFQENLGGLDVYSVQINEGGQYGELMNLGKPVNSSMDDFAWVYNNDNNEGYFASNRNLEASDNIFKVNVNKIVKTPETIKIEGVVRDKKTGEILDDVVVSLIDGDNNVIVKKIAKSGLYEFDKVDIDKARFIRIERNGYQTYEELIGDPQDGIVTTDIMLLKREIELKENTNIGSILNPIYFDLNKDIIRSDSEVELQKILAIMKKFPDLKIHIKSHTDSRANDSYNMKLSIRRAQSTMKYLIERGIDPSRLTGIGYGENELLNHCSNGVKCHEDEHQLNRRSEFIIKH